MLSDFAYILLFICGALIFVAIALLTASLIRPDRPNAEKNTSYECGEDPLGTAWGQFNIRFYVVALVFILFEVEVVFLFPWAVVFGRSDLLAATDWAWAWLAMGEMLVFIGVLALGLAYAWGKGFLDWVKPTPQTPTFRSPVPPSAYQAFNQRYQAAASNPEKTA